MASEPQIGSFFPLDFYQYVPLGKLLLGLSKIMCTKTAFLCVKNVCIQNIEPERLRLHKMHKHKPTCTRGIWLEN